MNPGNCGQRLKVKGQIGFHFLLPSLAQSVHSLSSQKTDVIRRSLGLRFLATLSYSSLLSYTTTFFSIRSAEQLFLPNMMIEQQNQTEDAGGPAGIESHRIYQVSCHSLVSSLFWERYVRELGRWGPSFEHYFSSFVLLLATVPFLVLLVTYCFFRHQKT